MADFDSLYESDPRQPEPVAIYALYRPGDDVFYVGATKDQKRRLKEHRTRFGREVRMVILEVVEGDWRPREHFWIDVCREADLNLANLTESGDGYETLSAALRAQISERMKGRPVSEETRRKMSAATKGKPHNWTREGKLRAAETQIKPGSKPWNTFTPDMTETEKEAIRERIRSGQRTETIASLTRITAEQSRRTWAAYTAEQRAERAHRARSAQRMKAKLTEEQTREIRSLYASGVMQKEISAMFGISQAAVSNIVNNKLWKP